MLDRRAIGERIGDLHMDAEPPQFPYDVDDPRIADIRHVLLEGDSEDGHRTALPPAAQQAANAFARDAPAHLVIDPASGKDDLGMVARLLGAIGEIIRVDADAVSAHETGLER